MERASIRMMLPSGCSGLTYEFVRLVGLQLLDGAYQGYFAQVSNLFCTDLNTDYVTPLP
jgi:hypothetical protein